LETSIRRHCRREKGTEEGEVFEFLEAEEGGKKRESERSGIVGVESREDQMLDTIGVDITEEVGGLRGFVIN